jgi:ketosteroid isomerase-like protein
MSQENLDVVREVVAAFNRRDLPTMVERFDPEVEWVPGGPAAVERGDYRGRDEVSGAFAATWETWDRFQVTESELHDRGDSILWLGRAQLKGAASQVEFDQEFAVHFLLRKSKIVRFQGFREWEEALRAAGPQE